MFPSSNSNNPFESLLKRSFAYDEQNPSFRQELEPPFLLHFPSPSSDDHESPLNQIFSQHQIINGHKVVPNKNQTCMDTTNWEPINKTELSKSNGKKEAKSMIAPGRKGNLGSVPRKRTGKKDRHSKICTARGIRDRRMRLSLQVARKFFDLQDMLGYDKASKTIEWLFTKSRKAIKELETDLPQVKSSSSSEAKSESFASECEVLSGIENSNTEFSAGSVVGAKNLGLFSNPYEQDDKDLRKPVSKPSSTRASRDKARARARDRTREKLIIKRLNDSELWYKQNPNNFEQLGCSTRDPFEAIEELIPQYVDSYTLDHQLTNVGITEHFLGAENSAFCPTSDYNQGYTAVSCCIDSNNNFMGFLGNWEMNSDRINPENCEMTDAVSFAGRSNPSCFIFGGN
ncbi:transcription factor CYCLOIDEA-like [Forsythia ovata]|uniref:Transcription factor CYCLOIDEA-like n=1 Tax=Forsythia ovata TaxID=205694 RepID=A0ABD1XAR1_9LAMI